MAIVHPQKQSKLVGCWITHDMSTYQHGKSVIPPAQAKDEITSLSKVNVVPDLVEQEWVALKQQTVLFSLIQSYYRFQSYYSLHTEAAQNIRLLINLTPGSH